MATNRTLLRAAVRASTALTARNNTIPRRTVLQCASRIAPAASTQTRLQPSLQRRWHSAPSGNDFKVYDFEKIKSLIESPTPSKVLIDVREPAEYTSHIPTALNMPITSQPDALFLPAPEFQDRFGFAKPSSETEVVFYCKAGVRSSAAAQLARQVGYQNVGEYRGSWMDWVKNGGSVEQGEK